MELEINEAGVERLRMLYSILPGLPKEHFNLHQWRTQAYSDDELVNLHCGTAACAVGWACAHPWFQEQGLKTRGICPDPVFNGYTSWDAAMAFFDVSRDTAEFLFGTKKTVLTTERYKQLKRLGYMKSLPTDERRQVAQCIRTVLLVNGDITRRRYNQLEKTEAMWPDR